MGSLFRSEEMVLAQLFIQPEAAYTSMSELGEIGVVQFRDLNEDVNVFQRKFVNEVRRCDEMERKLRYIESEVLKDGVNIPDNYGDSPKAPNPREISDLETYLEKHEGEIKELSDSTVTLKSNTLELTELKKVLEKTQPFFMEHDESNGSDSVHKSLIPEDSQNVSIRGRLGFVAGVINRERVPAFERMLWRISRGNVFLRQSAIEDPLEDPNTGNEHYKTVFVAFFQGEQLKARINKICAGFHATLYPCPSTVSERDEMYKSVRTRLEDIQMILHKTQDHRLQFLTEVAKELQNWSVMVRKMKAIYHTLNLFNMDVTKKCLIGECWVPVSDIPAVQKALTDGSNACGGSIPSFMNVINTNEAPPTFNRTNKFTRGFQNLIDAYGIASYREVNPALYTIITFPFLFAIMFGDAGHGAILLLFGLWMCVWEKKLMRKKISSEIWTIFFGGRYIILLMGIFSIYTGIFYNDVFSKSVNIFGSAWASNFTRYEEHLKVDRLEDAFTMDPTWEFDEEQYPLGLDPVWQLSKNKIIFLNTYKMKMSIIIGVVHMIFGVCMSVFNFVHFKKRANILLDFLPQILFLICLFFWMVVMMFVKWFTYSANNVGEHSPYCAPSVLILFINMMLFKENPPPSPVCKVYMFEGQNELQMALVAIALCCIPVLLVAKPIYIKMSRKSKHKQNVKTNGDVNRDGIEMQSQDHLDVAHEEEEEEESMSEICIHQAIHCIEYVLSTISHTASYLRLWALSLAHAQLSEVLWNMVMKMGLQSSDFTGAIMIYLIFAAWAFLTLSILVMMEGLSAFLHTLRLHWVEFMSKFYEGLGHPFHPYSFKLMLEEGNEEEDD